MSDFDLVLSGTVVLPDRIIQNGYVAVSGGKVAHVGEGPAPAARERHLLGEALILPGAIDAQTHSLSQKDQEDFLWSTNAAAAGGVTTIVDMPYDEGNLVCSAEAVKRKVDHASPQARVDFALYGTIDPLEGAARIAEQAEAGVAAFKFSTLAPIPSASRASTRRCSPIASPRSPRPGSPPVSTTRTTRQCGSTWTASRPPASPTGARTGFPARRSQSFWPCT